MPLVWLPATYTKQVTVSKQSLYLFGADRAAGDTNGQGGDRTRRVVSGCHSSRKRHHDDVIAYGKVLEQHDRTEWPGHECRR